MKKNKAKKPITEVLLMGTPSKNSDLLWFTGFNASDPFPAFSAHGKKIGLIPLLEVGRAEKESHLDEILNLTEIIKDLRKTNPQAGVADAIVLTALNEGIDAFRIPADFPVGLYNHLQSLGLKLVPASAEDKNPLFRNRSLKSKKEIQGIKKGNVAACAGFVRVEQILKESVITSQKKLQWRGKTLTAEILKDEIQVAVTRAGGLLDIGLICAPGDQAIDCHSSGTGPIAANQLIVVDIFPRDRESFNYGDMTRTYLKGKASPQQRKLVETVLEAQRRALKSIKAKKTGAQVHQGVVDFFNKKGYKTKKTKTGYEGFFHGTGHGLGFDIHEEPSLSSRHTQPLLAGECVTVEPGLYYLGLGGCRIEDCVLITKSGCEMLSKHPYDWEIS
jgi:Xaa-Pro aminopeptidase